MTRNLAAKITAISTEEYKNKTPKSFVLGKFLMSSSQTARSFLISIPQQLARG